jgi:nucleotide-binding universal stress UspA family protein
LRQSEKEGIMPPQILVPLDGSTLAEQALSCATMLAGGLPADIVLLQAVSLPPDLQDALDSPELATAQTSPLAVEAADYLSGVAERLEQLGLNVTTVVRCGSAAEAVLDYAEQVNIQQIVMATHGYSGISRWVHGSVAERILLSSSVPVLLVRAQDVACGTTYEPHSCRRILLPLDGSPIAEQVLAPATAVANALGAEIVLFRVPAVLTSMSLAGEVYMPLDNIMEAATQDAQRYLDGVASRLEAQGIRASTTLQIGGVANAIIEFAEENSIDLIAMCTHGRTGLARWALGSVADRVLRAGRVPLLLVRAQT